MLRRLVLCIALVLACQLQLGGAGAQQDAGETLRRDTNANVVRVMAGGTGGTAYRTAIDLAAVLDDGTDLRVLPILGKGSLQNITDILYLKGVDLAIVQADALTYARDNKIHQGLERRIHYVTRLYNEELHLLAGSTIEKIQDLAGKKVNFGPKDSGSFVTASNMFAELGIAVEPQTLEHGVAMNRLRAGEIDAMAFVAGKPASLIQSAPADGSLRLLSVPFTPGLLNLYLPSSLVAKDYPNLLSADGKVDTIAVGAVMIAFNWKPDTKRYANVARFVSAFFNRFEEFQKPPRHTKWVEVNLNADIPEWNRFRAAQDWLDEFGPSDRVFSYDDLRGAVGTFLDAEAAKLGVATDPDRDRELFRVFLRWLKTKPE